MSTPSAATTDLLLRYLHGDLDAVVQEAVRLRLDVEPALKAEHDQLVALEQTLAVARADSFAPYFADRVVRRAFAVAPAAPSFGDALQGLFPRLALASLLAAAGLATYGGVRAADAPYVASTLDAIFGLPSVEYESLVYFEETSLLASADTTP